jgi:hypothetical protein
VLQQSHKKAGILSSIIVCLFLAAISLFLVTYRQRISDQIIVWQFHPTSEVSGLVDRAGMNDNGKFYYLASQPKLDGTQTFNTECDRIENVTSILGCYNGSHIFIYDVTDKALDGIREVTAAHETLHAIYARMSGDEKTKVDTLLEAEYAKLQNDKDFMSLMSFYARSEPGERDNELHSIIGTEVINLDPALEAHYDEFFSNRQKVVNLNAKYSSVFINLKTRADELKKQYDTLSQSITSMTAQYNNDALALNKDITDFNYRAANNYFTSQSKFDSERNSLTARAAQLDALKASINDDIAKYKLILNEYNSIASQSKKLYNVIDSTLAPSPSV